jgi:hypothetical protein
MATPTDNDITISSRALAAIDLLSPREQRDVMRAIEQLRGAQSLPVGPTIKRLDGRDLYLVRPSPRVRLIVALHPDGTGEVLEALRPDALQRLADL